MSRIKGLGYLALAASITLLGGRSASAGDQDYYLSVALKSSIYKVDSQTLVATPYATGLGIPFYGFFNEDGDFFVPDRLLGAIFRIDPQGVVHIVSAGGHLSTPVAIVPDPSGGIMATDLLSGTVVHVALDGTQTLIHDNATSGGLVIGPGGLDFDPDGNLYVANNIGDTIVKITPQGAVSLFSNSPLVQSPGGIAIDGAGNMFVAMYTGNNIVRFRLDTGEAEVFSEDINQMIRPNDLKLSRSGGLLTTTRLSNLLRIDATGQITQEFVDFSFGEIVGVSVPEDATRCSGRFETYGAGMSGSGGFVPELRAVFSPCPGHDIALEWRDFLGGAQGLLFFGVQQASQPWLGGTLLVDLAGPSAIVPIAMPGVGAGNGDLTLQFTVDPNPALVGAAFYFQAVVADPAGPFGVVLSNGLKETIGS